MDDIYVDKIEIYPKENRAYVIYRKPVGTNWPKGKNKYEILLLKILSYDFKEWTLGRATERERSVIVEW
tara:strand:- start:83 stop:289 length:207 start_codon:yes stop_codon:yes gene_type:complete